MDKNTESDLSGMDDEESTMCEDNESSVDLSDDSNDAFSGNMGWADAMSNVLKSQVTKKKNFILAKAKKDSDVTLAVQKTEVGVEMIDDSGKVAPMDNSSNLKKRKTNPGEERKKIIDRQQKRYLWENMCRTKPDITNKDRERTLVRIATSGVVQLFNAVEKHQKSGKKSLKGPDKKNKSTAVAKGCFMDMLKGNINEQVKSENAECVKDKPQQEETWGVLKDDFMMGATLKDWDKESDSDGN